MERFDDLASELVDVFSGSVRSGLTEERFDSLAARVFTYQFERNEPFRRFCEGRGFTPRSVVSWRAVPAVPTDAFKSVRLCSVPEEEIEATFRTSGTTSGRVRRGWHEVPSLELYRASALPHFAARILPDVVDVGASLASPVAGSGEERSGGPADPPDGDAVRVICLLPNPVEVPDSSLSTMLGMVVDRWGSEESGWFVDSAGGVRWPGVREALRRAERATEVVLVAGTAFGFVHLLDRAEVEGWSVALPPTARIVETGGFKGRSREVSRSDLYEALGRTLGVPVGRIVNEYGMTEMLSQFYEPVWTRSFAGVDERFHLPPPWVRSRVLDPVSLEPAPTGARGVLAHFDLANLGSVAHVLTSDLAVALEEGFRLLGRARGAEPRGCSLAMEEFVRARGRVAGGQGG